MTRVVPSFLLATLAGVLLSIGCTESPASDEKKAGDKSADAKADQKPEAADEIVVYSGRNESLVGPVLQAFEKKTGKKLKVRYGDTAELAALLVEEGAKSPAAMFLAQDAGALGAVSDAKLFAPVPASTLSKVAKEYQADDGTWVGVTGRARSVVYNTKKVKEDELPASVFDLTDAKYKGRIGWAPGNGSFQAFVTAMRLMHGEEKTKEWLLGMKKNDVKDYPKNSAIVRATGAGEVDLGLVNHYYLYRFTKEDKDFPAKNHYTKAGDIGALVNVSGAGILKSAKPAAKATAEELLAFLVSKEAQDMFAQNAFEYPVVEGAVGPAGLPSLKERKPPKLDLGKLQDLKGTLALLRETKALP